MGMDREPTMYMFLPGKFCIHFHQWLFQLQDLLQIEWHRLTLPCQTRGQLAFYKQKKISWHSPNKTKRSAGILQTKKDQLAFYTLSKETNTTVLNG